MEEQLLKILDTDLEVEAIVPPEQIAPELDAEVRQMLEIDE